MENTEAMAKSLTDLIDETLQELEEMKKGGRMEPETITMGHDANGEMKKEEDGDKEEDEEENDKAEKAEKDYDKDEDDKEDDKAEKAEGANQMVKAEDVSKAEMKMKKAQAKFEMRKADYEMKKAMCATGSKGGKGENEKAMAKTAEAPVQVSTQTESLEARLNELTTLVKKIADAPVPARGQTYRDVQPLAKSAEEIQPLVKSNVMNALFELKKSGKDVTAEDMFKAETGGSAELAAIANKHGIK